MVYAGGEGTVNFQLELYFKRSRLLLTEKPSSFTYIGVQVPGVPGAV